MGGYAAILFSTLTKTGEVIAFAPQTFISPILRLKNMDYRWQKQITKTYLKTAFKPKAWDLKTLLEKEGSKRKISIFVSKTSTLDLRHAMHIRDTQGVFVHEFEEGGHGVVKLLRDEGRLPEIMSGEYGNETRQTLSQYEKPI